MTPYELWIAHAVKALVAVTLVGVVCRQRHRLCRAFPAYLLVILACNCLTSFWPEVFFNRRSWMLQHALFDLAKMAVALELAYRTFRAFPGARSVARVLLSVILVLTTAALVRLPPMTGSTPESFLAVLTEWQPRVLSGTIWMLTATTLLIVWYHLPVHPFQRAILLGFTPYLLVFTTLLSILRTRGWSVRSEVNLVEGITYVAVVAWWAYEAWRPAPRLSVDPQVMQRLRLEHV